jgi:cytochrome c
MFRGRLMFLRASSITLGIVSTAQAQDAATGQRLFTMNCSACHSPKPGQNLVGPSLFNVINRHSGQIPNFHYSQAKKSVERLQTNISS